MQKIPLHLIESLVVVAESKTFDVAARKLQISQPGLSKQMLMLEKILPVPLFAIDGRKKILTPFGNALAQELKPKLDGVESIISRSCDEYSNPDKVTVRIIGRVGVTDKINSKLNFPGRLIFIDAPSDKAIDAVRNQQADFGITFQESDTTDLIGKKLYVESYKFVIPSQLFNKRTSNIEAVFDSLKNLPCITYKENDQLFDQILSKFKTQVSDLNIKRTISNFDSISKLVEAGVGWSMVPRHFSLNSKHVWSIDVPAEIHESMQFYLYYRRHKNPSQWFIELRNNIQNAFKE